MSVNEPFEPSPSNAAGKLYADDRFMVRNRHQIRHLLQSMIDQRSMINAHPDGRDQSFPSAVLEVDEHGLLLDASPLPSLNRTVESAATLLCFGLVDKVTVRFQLQQPRRVERDGHIAFQVPLPEEVYHLQRREFYRLETPVGDSPYCLLPDPDGGQPSRWRVLDISAGGLALMLPAPQNLLSLQSRYHGCELQIPESPPIITTMVACNLRQQKQANGVEMTRVGLRFDGLPRGADTLIQRYIFRIDRLRKARANGD
ncbi:pilus assembly protein PilZ [Stenotrophomonas humi]|uniref:Flagellar brake protein YcgR n=1 Tax=Stenotrophomonas humi TaxID=405444 RepID=A0A0R0C8S6_9GAMM|nr:flagellar brake protein [Stenotrophomonas humi]KRG62906.1 pilus assembly protein PilZ [Stenotrophomonas humi]